MQTPTAILYNPQDFTELLKLVRENGLLKRSPIYYTWKIISTFVFWCSGFIILYFVRDNIWLVLLDAVYLAFAYGQIGLLGHDAGHRQIFDRTWLNDMVLYPGTFLVGMSATSWMFKHNNHHAHPNRHDEDPDLEYPMIAFDEHQVHEKTSKLERFVIKRQAWLFPILILPFPALSIKLTGLKHILTNPFKQVWLDSITYFGHYLLYFGMVFGILSFWPAIAFILVHQILFGVYLGMIFAPNHKGMPTFNAGDKVDFLREQVLTSRNMRGSLVTDFVYGGLNYQIEHHLFPYMPRNKFGRAQKIVRDFCKSKGISYHETSVFGGIREIFSHLHQISLYARTVS